VLGHCLLLVLMTTGKYVPEQRITKTKKKMGNDLDRNPNSLSNMCRFSAGASGINVSVQSIIPDTTSFLLI